MPYKVRFKMKFFRRWKWYYIVLIVLCVLPCLDYFGAFSQLWELDYDTEFFYPLDIDLEPHLKSLRLKEQPTVQPIVAFNYTYLKSAHKCIHSNSSNPRLVFVIKSAMDHFERRQAIRETWGFERRFSDVSMERIFVVGISTDDVELQKEIDRESSNYGDIVQAAFIDSYSNNTIKTMMSIKWVVQNCPSAEFAVFADDDMYLSTKNVLRFLRNPKTYPTETNSNEKTEESRLEGTRLYAGYVFHSPPLRHKFSKWYVSLEEYPFTLWPPYATAGAYVVSQNALLDLYYGSMYTKLFRFDDVYLGLVARKVHIEPLHCSEFYFWKKPYSPAGYRNVIASHGYSDPAELKRIWQEQKSLGHA